MKPSILKIAAILLVLVGGLVSCRDKEKGNNSQNGKDNNITLSGTWAWEYDHRMTLTFYPNEGENDGKFYSTVPGDNNMIMFRDDTWTDYKIENDTMLRVGCEVPPEMELQRTWFIRQHTEDVLELEYAGYYPFMYIGSYLLKAQN